jgi:hypothetical protein
VAEALLPHFTCPAERLQALGDVARAAGGAGDGEKFDSTYQEMERLCANPESIPAHARAFLDAAYGAANLLRSDLTHKIAGRALAAAKHRREGKVILDAEALLGTLETRRSVSCAHSSPNAPTIDNLSVELIGALSRQQGASCLTR